MENPTLQVEGISKAFPGVQALEDVSFSCYAGKVYALVGENGAGKSTLLKIISGIIKGDKGNLYLYGERVNFRNPFDAEQKGIGMVFQELSLFPDMDIAQNLFIGKEPKRKNGLIDRQAQLKKTEELLKKYRLELEPDMLVSDLSAAEKQMIEIVKILNRDPQILFLDEATSSLAASEVEQLFCIINELKKQKKTIIFISHRMQEIFEIADEVIVMKDGRHVGGGSVKELSENRIIEMMVGRSLTNIFPPKSKDLSDVIFEVKNLGSEYGFKDVNFCIRKGEVLGIAGLQGHGQTELMCTLAGVLPHNSGEILIKRKRINYHNTRQAIRQGVVLVPEDRKLSGLCLSHSVRKNIALASLHLRLRRGLIDKKAESQVVGDMIQSLHIKTPSEMQTVSFLSGGNQQKVVLAKCLAIKPKVLLFDEPTRGIDVAAKQEFYKIIRELAEEGIAILVCSSDLLEIIGICDRVMVMYEKKVVDIIEQDRMTEEEIMHSAMGLRREEAV